MNKSLVEADKALEALDNKKAETIMGEEGRSEDAYAG